MQRGCRGSLVVAEGHGWVAERLQRAGVAEGVAEGGHGGSQRVFMEGHRGWLWRVAEGVVEGCRGCGGL